ncbi:AAA family ATPase [Aureimonas ureilytica]|uniref:AAA family ATPase n=1 Tax=Aureimonas ureilytica TaxID=401562 RepID=UPI00037A1328|nr:AAA family ATPase [Aureimonas ureilytica]
MATGIENRQSVFSWLTTFLRDLNLQFSRSGFKGGSNIGNHTVDEGTGYWGNPQYSGNKPPRWLFHVDVTGAGAVARLPADLQEIGIGGSNTAQGDKAGLAIRILPLIQIEQGAFRRADDFEANVLFVFHGALDAGSSSDAFSFDPATGGLFRSVDRAKRQERYVFAALLGLRPRTDTIEVEKNGAPASVSYGDAIDAIRSAIHVHPQDGALEPIPLYDLSDDDQVEALKTDITAAWEAAGPPPVNAEAAPQAEAAEAVEDIDFANIEIPVDPDLLGIDPAVYRQINAMLRSGKQHIMLYGPPGTGKTSLARWIASSLPGGQWTLVTGSSDWSSQDIIGGYQPIGGGEVDFVPGILLRAFDQPLIIDELNRCDIDKVIGPLFTVLSGQQTTLPYRTDISDRDSQPYVILPRPKAGAADHEFAPGPAWRLVATINSIDKASLYQMSYALSRRFGWVYVDAPTDLAAFIAEYLTATGAGAAGPAAGAVCPLAEVWKAINAARVIGPAPIIDAIKAIRELAPGAGFFEPADAAMRSAALDAVDMVLLPMLDGVLLQDARNIAEAIVKAYDLTGAEADRVKRRLDSVAI